MTPYLSGALLGLAAGAIVGSFLATLILRWPQGRSIVRGRSACDGCGRVLNACDLVPLLSALVARGRCRSCGVVIDPLHYRVEMECALIGALALGLMPGIDGAVWALLGWLLLTLAILDWRHFWLPDALTLPLAFLGFVVGPFVTDISVIDRAIGALAGYLALLAVSVGYRLLRGREGLGQGDAKLLGAIGAWFGWMPLPFILLMAASLGLIVAALSRIAGQEVKATTRLPLGTFLAAATIPGALAAALLVA